jgi:hypothetical protein
MGGKRAKKGVEKCGTHLEGKLNKPNNAFDVEPNHVKKIGPTVGTWDVMKGPTPTPKGQ